MTRDTTQPDTAGQERSWVGRHRGRLSERGWTGGMAFRVAMVLLVSLFLIELITHFVIFRERNQNAQLALQQAVAR